MFYIALFLCVLLNVYISIFFRAIKDKTNDNLQIIVFNYLICAITGFIFSYPLVFKINVLATSWWPFSIIFGFLFFSLFNIIAFCSKNYGAGITSVSNKLSLLIPAIFGVIYFHEKLAVVKIVALAMAIVGVFLILLGKKENHGKSGILLIVLFFGSGILDTLVNFLQKKYVVPEQQGLFLSYSFLAGFIFGLCYILLFKKLNFNFKSTFKFSIILGIPNYFSIYFLILMLSLSPLDSSSIIPINNIIVVLLAVFTGWILYSEKLNRKQFLGFALSLSSILLLAFKK